ncbi:MAG TPA: YIP1 family protein [Nitrospinota bacterium]|nr:YIP1 family protein [Nitrospinota bacterium]
MASFSERIIRAAKLDVKVYEEIEADKEAFAQAIMVVVLSSIAAGIGSLSKEGLGGLFIVTIGALLGWFFWAYLTYLIGTKILPEAQTQADYGQLLRTIGFSSSPGLIRILGIIPFLKEIIFMVATLWMLVAMIIAVRQALDYTSTLRAVIVCVIGWVFQVVIFSLLFAIL